jgi:putative Holliday junction resolvase
MYIAIANCVIGVIAYYNNPVLCFKHMRRIGIDFGTKRVGISLSDEAGTMAFPHDVFENNSDLFKKIISLIEEKSVQEIVIGHSLDREGNPNKIHEAVEVLVTDLTLETGLPIHLEPEQYTTQEAVRIQGKNDMTDAAAATIILNHYISRA